MTSIDKLKRIIARRGYARKRMAKLRRKLYANARRFYKRCDFSKVSAAFFDAEQKRIGRKMEWYHRCF